MGWLADILGFFKRDPSMVKLITEKFRELHEITENENKELKKKIAALEMMIAKNQQDIEKIELHESDCHQMLKEEREKYRNLREWIIFETGKKPPK